MSPRRGIHLTLIAIIGAGLCGCRSGSSGARSNQTLFDAISPPTPAEAAAMAADPFNADKRQKGILLLANAPFGGERVYVRLYEIGLDDEDTGVQTVSVKALGLHGSPDHVVAIANLLETTDDPVLRWEAARAMQRLHNPEVAVPVLIKGLSEYEDPDVRGACATALGQYAEGRVFDALVAALDDPSLHVNLAAQRSLGTLTGQRLGTVPTPWLDWQAQTADLFAGRRQYEYPVFERDRRIVEWLVPWLEPPNETSAPPAGMVGEARRDVSEPG